MNGEPYVIPAGQVLPPMQTPKPRPSRTAPPAGRGDGRTEPPPKRTAGRGGAIKKRFALLNAVADCELAGLRGHEPAVWLVLFRHAKPNGETSAAVSDIARRCGCNAATAKRALAALRRKGLLRTIKRGSLAGGAGIYRLQLPAE